MDSNRRMTFKLQHELMLFATDTSGKMGIHEISDFLSSAMMHFKSLRDTPKANDTPSSRYQGKAKNGRKVLCIFELIDPHVDEEDWLTPAQWTQAIIDAYTIANTIEQLLDQLPDAQRAAERDGGYMREVIAMLDQPGGDVRAFDAMLKRPPLT